MKTKHTIEEWEKRFDEEFVIHHGEGVTKTVQRNPQEKEIKAFIHSLLEEERSTGGMDLGRREERQRIRDLIDNYECVDLDGHDVDLTGLKDKI